MNINLQNQGSTAMEHMIKNIDRQEFYTGILTRARIANIYDKYYPTLISKLPLNEDKAIRTLLVYSLRYINMTLQHIDVLLVNGLTEITRLDLDRPERDLARQLASENREISDLDTISRIVGQINNKLPNDLQERYTPLLKIATIQKLLALLGAEVILGDREASVFGQKLVPKPVTDGIKEAFQNNNRLDANTSQYVSSANNNKSANGSLDNNYLDDLDKVLGKNEVATLQEQGYDLRDISRERIKMNINKGTYDQQLADLISSGNTTDQVTTDVIPKNVLLGKYVDMTPEIQMDAKTKELYYFDDQSRSLVPLKDVEKINADAISRRKLEAMLKDYELSNKELDAILLDTTNEDGKGDKRKYNAKGEVINTTKLTDAQRNRLKLDDGLAADAGLDNWYIYLIVLVVIIMIVIGSYFGYRYYKSRPTTASNNAGKRVNGNNQSR